MRGARIQYQRISILKLVLLCLTFVTSTVHAQAQLSHQEKLVQAENDFKKGYFKEAAKITDQVFENNAALSAEEKSQLFLLKSRISFAFGQSQQMEKWLDLLYEVNPHVELDPLQDPPAAYEYLKKLRIKNPPKPLAIKTPLPLPPPALPPSKPPAEESPGEITPPAESESLAAKIARTEEPLKSESRFWLGLVPFGIGHFDARQPEEGYLYLGTESLIILVAAELDRRNVESNERAKNFYSHRIEERNYHGILLGVTGYLGAWGHEIADLAPELHARDAGKTQWARYMLSYFPFGVGQAKNGDMAKSIGVGCTEAALLLLSIAAPTSTQRTLSLTLFYSALAYGAFDGWLYHDWKYEPLNQKKSAFNLSFAPLISAQSQIGMGLNFRLAF
jgi:hypothetical protein